MIETLLLPLFATTARLRTLSTATPVGEVPTGIEATQTPGKVAGGGLQMAGAGDVRAISVMSLEPRLATTAIPVAVLIATAPGCMPAFSAAMGVEGMFPGEGCTAKFATATCCAAAALRTAKEINPGAARSLEPLEPPMTTLNCRALLIVAECNEPSNSAVTAGNCGGPGAP